MFNLNIPSKVAGVHIPGNSSGKVYLEKSGMGDEVLYPAPGSPGSPGGLGFLLSGFRVGDLLAVVQVGTGIRISTKRWIFESIHHLIPPDSCLFSERWVPCRPRQHASLLA